MLYYLFSMLPLPNWVNVELEVDINDCPVHTSNAYLYLVLSCYGYDLQSSRYLLCQGHRRLGEVTGDNGF